MNKNQFLELIEKYLEGKATLHEHRKMLNYYESFQESKEWSKSLGDKDVFKAKMFLEIKRNTNLENKKKSKIKRLPLKSLLKYVAIFIGIIGLTYFYTENTPSNNNFRVATSLNENEITLTLDNGNKKIISEDGQQKIINTKGQIISSQTNGELNYTESYLENTLAYNTLKTPYGKKFKVILSDGTKVYLNAGSSIKYPVKFFKGQKRKVFLEGEAYFDVAKDKLHPFIVSIKDFNVKVLGTQFNLSFYPEDVAITTVLVEGSVELYEENKKNISGSSTILLPNHKATWNLLKKEILLEKVDVNEYISWKNDEIVFTNLSFKQILIKLERSFNISIENEYKFLGNQLFSASFDKKDSIEDILKAFYENTPFKYKIENKKIIIKKPID